MQWGLCSLFDPNSLNIDSMLLFMVIFSYPLLLWGGKIHVLKMAQSVALETFSTKSMIIILETFPAFFSHSRLDDAGECILSLCRPKLSVCHNASSLGLGRGRSGFKSQLKHEACLLGCSFSFRLVYLTGLL